MTSTSALPITKFSDARLTAKGEPRAHIAYEGTKTLWFNTGTLCNIACANCYIKSSPTNDDLVYLTLNDVTPYLDELEAAGECPVEIGITGGEPFMVPEIIDILEACLARGHRVLILTNAMQPLMRPRIQTGLLRLLAEYGSRLVLRISLDHYTARAHDEERGAGSFELTLRGMGWLSSQGFTLAAAGRSMWSEDEAVARAGFKALFRDHAIRIDADDAQQLVIFPEMREGDDPPEISTACWDILDSRPEDQMCATQRMVVKRKGAPSASVVSCTLLPYERDFELGNTLAEARKDVALNHPWCATFCVLGGGSCSG